MRVRAQRMPKTLHRPLGTPVIVVVVVVVMTRGARTRLVHALEGARKTALQHIGNGKPRAVATRSQRSVMTPT